MALNGFRMRRRAAIRHPDVTVRSDLNGRSGASNDTLLLNRYA